MRAALCCMFVLFFCVRYCRAQTPVNGYAKITSISGNVLNVSNVNETYDTFEDGEYVIVMQMQDNVIGTTTNTSGFGSLGSILSAGLYEVAQIASHTEVASLPSTITLTTSLANTYNTTATGAVQLISYPTLGSPNYNTSFDISAVPWNGTTGGVIALWVNGVLTLNNNITANGAGFRGGGKNTPDAYTGCDATTYQSVVSSRYAYKGESIYLNSTAAYQAARGRMLNGGGGGNDVNAGGGGGGNYSAGGDGGIGWTPSGTGCSPGVGGLGGLSMSAQISGGRVFMGGGGGGGHENDNVGTTGGNGGGIILLRANSIVTSGTCASHTISANGITPAAASNDGAGGAGAGGSIVLQVGSYSIGGSCPLVISANGGNGGSSNAGSSGSHGGGGGGGQGAVIFSGAQPTTNVTTQTTSGTGGVSCSGCTAAQNGSSGGGTANSGIIPGTNNPLPVELLFFDARPNGNRVDVTWETASEINCNYFEVERATDNGWTTMLGQVEGSGTTTQPRFYQLIDNSPNPGMNYYRLHQVDFNGQRETYQWVAVEFTVASGYVTVFPNPSDGALQVVLSGYKDEQLQLTLTDVTGRVVKQQTLTVANEEQSLLLGLEDAPAGMYFLSVRSAVRQEVVRVVRR